MGRGKARERDFLPFPLSITMITPCSRRVRYSRTDRITIRVYHLLGDVVLRHAFKSGRHIKFLIYDVIRGKASALMSGREAKSDHCESLYSILFLYKH